MEDDEIDDEIIECSLTIYPKEKIIYLGETCSSGCEYSYKNFNDLIRKIKFYFGFYHEDKLKNMRK